MGTLDKLMDHVATRFAASTEILRAEIASGLSSTRNGLKVRAATAQQFLPNNRVNAGACRLNGWTLTVAGGTARVTLTDARSADGGDVLGVITLATDGASSTHWMGPGGVSAGEGVWAAVTVLTGTPVVTGSLFFGVVD